MQGKEVDSQSGWSVQLMKALVIQVLSEYLLVETEINHG
jgi:hypothetical protein